jgi:hypothetical protein
MTRITYESLARAAMTKKMIENTRTTQLAGGIVARKGEIAGTKRSSILKSLQLGTLIDATTGMMTGAVKDVMIVEIIIAVDLEAVEVAGGTTIRVYLICRLRTIEHSLLHTRLHLSIYYILKAIYI